ncbi:MAG: DUF4347 domain-containing protein, partial [Pseudomonadota bacterium]
MAIYALEERILFDAAAPADLADAQHVDNAQAPATIENDPAAEIQASPGHDEVAVAPHDAPPIVTTDPPGNSQTTGQSGQDIPQATPGQSDTPVSQGSTTTPGPIEIEQPAGSGTIIAGHSDDPTTNSVDSLVEDTASHVSDPSDEGDSVLVTPSPEEIDAHPAQTHEDISTEIGLGGSDSHPSVTQDLSVGAEQPHRDVVFLDTSLPDRDSLLASLPENAQVVLVDSTQSGLQVISQTLANATDIDAVHIISHGDSGTVVLGSDVITVEDLKNNQETVSAWSSAFKEDGDIFIYGCDVAEGATGHEFVDTLAQLTNTEVAASTDATGQNGDWSLEYATGHVDQALILPPTLSKMATITVTATNDVVDAGDGVTSLREALILANSNGDASNTIIFDSSVFTNPTAGTITLTGTELTISKSVSIVGDGHVTIDGAATSRIFNIDDNNNATFATVSLSGLVLQHGSTGGNGGGILTAEDTTISHSTLTNNSAGGSGGGIYASLGTLDITDSTISGNTALSMGGGINGHNATINATNVAVTGNSAAYEGGGVFLNNTTAHITASNVSHNQADEGGGIMSREGSATTITNSTVSDNIAANSAGGVQTKDGQLTITNSTIARNTATNYVGGVTSMGSILTISNSTISGNSANHSGGLALFDGTGTIANSTIAGNTSTSAGGVYDAGGILQKDGTLSLTSTIVANNTAGGSANDVYITGTAVFNADHSLVEDNHGFSITSGTNNILGQDPLLGALLDNGGPTVTHALLAGSAAINTGSNPDSLTTDQRGMARDINGTDIGAYERTTSLVVDTTADENDGDFSANNLSLREALSLVADGGTITFDSSVFTPDDDIDTGKIILDGSELDITKSVSIVGDGNVTIDGAGTSRIFSIDDGNAAGLADITLSGLALQHGFSGGHGGGLTTVENTTIVDCSISTNTAQNGGGMSIYDGTTTIVNSTISNNSATVGGGGGIGAYYCTLVINDSTISGNSTVSYCGGVGMMNGTATISNSTIAGNSAAGGAGGVGISGGTLTISNSTIAGNTAVGGSGGVGGGPGSTLDIVNSTISGNVANEGGGLSTYNCDATISNSTIAGNTSHTSGGGIRHDRGSMTLHSTIVADNSAVFDNDIHLGAGSLNADHSLIEDPNGHSIVNGVNGNIVGFDPLLAPLADNGGPTMTHALLAGSLVINTGSNPNGLTTDQRGLTRDVGGTDIGAYERTTALVVDTTADENDGDFSAGDLSLREALSLVGDG